MSTAPLFTATLDHTRQARERAAERFASLERSEPSSGAVRAAYASIHEIAERISGTSVDSGKRAVHYYALYEESSGNFMFPLVATHGSLWGVRHTVRLERWLAPLQRLSRHGRIERWMQALDAVRDVNRRVFVEIYTTFYFTRFYGDHPVAEELVHPDVLPLYQRVHRAIRNGEPLDRAARREVYYGVFLHEQEHIVDPGVLEAAQAAGSAVLLAALKRVSPRFAYFPEAERLWFTDFTDVEQRNREGLRALAFAEEVGAARVFEAMSAY